MEQPSIGTAVPVPAPAAAPAAELVGAAREFEAYFLKLLLSEMRKSVLGGGLFESHTTRAYEDLLHDALASRAAEAGTFGLARQLVARLPIDYQGLL